MSIPKLEHDLNIIQKLSDLPNSTEGLSANQLKAKFDEAALYIQKWLNEQFIPSIVAENIPFTSSLEIEADNLADAIVNVQGQVKDASTGSIVNGSVTTEKLSAALLARTYGGRPWVSIDTPGSVHNTATDFPIGQIWLRPPFEVINEVTENWSVSGCSVSGNRDKLTVTGNSTVATVTITQLLSGIGNDGDRVYVLLTPANKDKEITDLTVRLNGGEEEPAANGVFTGTLTGGNLTLRIAAAWPTTSLAKGSFDLVNITVVNIDGILRQTTNARELSNWAGYLKNLLPLSRYASPEEVFIQTINGTWWPVGKAVYPVSRGGTGLDSIADGAMIYGKSGKFKALAAGANDSVLRFRNGIPAWEAIEKLYADGKGVRMATGSYKGNAAERTINLGVTPVLLVLWDASKNPRLFVQGTKPHGQYDTTSDWDNSVITYYAYIELSGSSLVTSANHGSGHPASTPAVYYNANGSTYNWIALYLTE